MTNATVWQTKGLKMIKITNYSVFNLATYDQACLNIVLDWKSRVSVICMMSEDGARVSLNPLKFSHFQHFLRVVSAPALEVFLRKIHYLS